MNKGLDIAFPPQCISCKASVEKHGNLCHKCWEAINFISSPQCKTCGTPFELETNENTICGKCISSPPLYKKARSVFSYDENSYKLITNYKYYDNTQNSQYFANWLYRIGKDLIEDSDIITPVPLHRIRLISRRYNQAALLCNQLGKLSGKAVNNQLLVRHKHTKPQASLTFKSRSINVKHAFRANDIHKQMVEGKNILLVDDVITTGATIHSCTKQLLKAGAKNIYVLTLAMTVKD